MKFNYPHDSVVAVMKIMPRKINMKFTLFFSSELALYSNSRRQTAECPRNAESWSGVSPLCINQKLDSGRNPIKEKIKYNECKERNYEERKIENEKVGRKNESRNLKTKENATSTQNERVIRKLVRRIDRARKKTVEK